MKSLYISFAILILSFGCQQKSGSKKDFSYYFSKSEQKEILAKIVSYIYIAPPQTDKSERFLPIHRQFYLNETEKFQVTRFFQNEEGKYFFYLVRPARNVNGYKRGVAGSFTLSENMEIDFFEEVFVTKMIPETDVINFGNLIFDDFISTNGSLVLTPVREDLIEFPGIMSQYDSIQKEWTYKEPN
jgi:hypothetical protein